MEEDIHKSPTALETTYELPEDISLIMKIAPLVQKYPWDISLNIWTMTVKISKEGHKELNILLS